MITEKPEYFFTRCDYFECAVSCPSCGQLWTIEGTFSPSSYAPINIRCCQPFDVLLSEEHLPPIPNKNGYIIINPRLDGMRLNYAVKSFIYTVGYALRLDKLLDIMAKLMK